MDRKLFEAAETGNVQQLHQILTENPLIFHSVAMASAENPLHIACMAGHVEFVREILRSKPDFAKEVNQDGLSPMHVASANGHLEIVRELLKVDGNLCRLEGIREKKTPLHYAAVKGRVEVIADMLLACPECVGDVTVNGETALHLAVKHSQFEAVKVLVEWVREMKIKDIVNCKDEQGNTVLHVAAWKKQRPVIELLIHNEAVIALEINAINQSGLTALDLLKIFPSEAGDREIEEILRGSTVGAISARRVDSHNIHTTPAAAASFAASRTSLVQPKNLEEYFKFKKGRDSPSNARNSLLVISVLVATATYQVGLSPPGGVWQDGEFRGQSIMGYNSEVTFLFFMFFNSVGFSVSLFMINILTANFPMHSELQISMLAMFATYSIAVVTIAPNRLKLYVTIFTSVLPSLVRPVARGVRQLIWKHRNSRISSSGC